MAATAVGRVGVAGSGTMGAGIAQLACGAGFETTLYDPMEQALGAAAERIAAGLQKAGAPPDSIGRLTTTSELGDLSACELVIEAAPERLDVKRELFAAIGDGPILATNTSSLPVAAIASAAPDATRVCGMHFFNPPPRMPLVEVVAGMDTDPDVIETAMEVARRMGRTPIRAADAPGFLANRCARPFGLEGLRLLGDGIATHDQIDRICRVGGGFRMGPFELMDLVGVDVNFEVAKSFFEQSFQEPRWQPHPIQAQMRDAGRHGRKTGRGYYDYSSRPYRPEDPEPAGADGLDQGAAPDGLRLVPLATGTFAAQCATDDAVGFYILPPLGEARLVELVRGPNTSDASAAGAEGYFGERGLHHEWIGDSPGAVLGRIVCQLVNEAAFALQRGIGAAEDIDTAMRLGFNWPRGPLEWADSIGIDHVVAVLAGLHSEYREERYRISPLLLRLCREGRLGHAAGRGFFSY